MATMKHLLLFVLGVLIGGWVVYLYWRAFFNGYRKRLQERGVMRNPCENCTMKHPVSGACCGVYRR